MPQPSDSSNQVTVADPAGLARLRLNVRGPLLPGLMRPVAVAMAHRRLDRPRAVAAKTPSNAAVNLLSRP